MPIKLIIYFVPAGQEESVLCFVVVSFFNPCKFLTILYPAYLPGFTVTKSDYKEVKYL